MKAIHIDIPSGREMQAHEVPVVGTVGFCSWRRLQEVLSAALELRRDETLKSVQIDDRGITYRVE